MSRVCVVCNKGPMFGNNVSHANNKTRKVWYPNLQKMRVIDSRTGVAKKMKVCTSCLRSGFVKKAPS